MNGRVPQGYFSTIEDEFIFDIMYEMMSEKSSMYINRRFLSQ